VEKTITAEAGVRVTMMDHIASHDGGPRGLVKGKASCMEGLISIRRGPSGRVVEMDILGPITNINMTINRLERA
jgi:hypothetical protein